MPASIMPKVGDEAPAFGLPAAPDGKEIRLADLRGRKVVLYFYPRDMTPGCTTEACDFRDSHQAIVARGAVVLGISPDGIDSHRKFAEQHGLLFPLLSDEDHAVAETYGAWVEKNMYGKKSWGVQRATFLIAGDGKIAAVWPRVRVDGHVAKVVTKLEELG